MKILIVGDSQAAGPPGQHAEAKLRAAGHQTQRVGNPGRGPYDYVRMPELWAQYTGAVRSFRPDVILLIFGSNDLPGGTLTRALTKLKQDVAPPVYISGPPQYPSPDAQARGAGIKDAYQSVYGARFIDAYPFTDPSLPRAPDGLHFTREGGRPWGEGAAGSLLALIQAAPPPPLVEAPAVLTPTGATVAVGLAFVAAAALGWWLLGRRSVKRNRRVRRRR